MKCSSEVGRKPTGETFGKFRKITKKKLQNGMFLWDYYINISKQKHLVTERKHTYPNTKFSARMKAWYNYSYNSKELHKKLWRFFELNLRRYLQKMRDEASFQQILRKLADRIPEHNQTKMSGDIRWVVLVVFSTKCMQ